MRAEVCADILNQFFRRHALVYISVTTFLPPQGLPEWKQIEGIGQSANLGRSTDSSSHLTYILFLQFFCIDDISMARHIFIIPSEGGAREGVCDSIAGLWAGLHNSSRRGSISQEPAGQGHRHQLWRRLQR